MNNTTKRTINMIKKTVKRYFNIKTLFTLLQAACVVIILGTIGHMDMAAEMKIANNDFQSFCIIGAAILAIILLNIFGAIITRILYFNKMLKRRNVIRFFFEYMD